VSENRCATLTEPSKPLRVYWTVRVSSVVGWRSSPNTSRGPRYLATALHARDSGIAGPDFAAYAAGSRLAGGEAETPGGMMSPGNWVAVGAVGTVVASLVGICGFIAVVWQLRSSRRIAEADFVLRTQTAFADALVPTYAKFLKGGEWSAEDGAPPFMELPVEALVEVQHYLDFFNTLAIVRASHLISLATINDMFAYRFFVVAHSEYGAATMASAEGYFAALIALYADWRALRERSGQEMPAMNSATDVGRKAQMQWEAAYPRIATKHLRY
jgi:hypothetical protein